MVDDAWSGSAYRRDHRFSDSRRNRNRHHGIRDRRYPAGTIRLLVLDVAGTDGKSKFGSGRVVTNDTLDLNSGASVMPRTESRPESTAPRSMSIQLPRFQAVGWDC